MLEFSQVVDQIDGMGKTLAERAARNRKALPAARELLRLYAHDQDELVRVAESEAGQRLRCARPTVEPLDLAAPVPAAPSQATLVAADGSQIYPDSHGAMLYYVINTGTIVFRQGSGQAPQAGTHPQLYFSEDRVYPDGRLISTDLISAERDLAEMQALAQLASQQPLDGSPLLALGDGSLLIWLQRAAIPEGHQARLLDAYLACLDQLRAGQVPVAAFVSRPQSAEVVALLYLRQLEPEERQDLKSLAETPFRGLTDRALFGFLKPGDRSALFVRGTAANQGFRARGHEVRFFYLNTGTDVARVEVPEWVARDPQQTDRVHALVYEQCRYNNGYPYVLTRADEQAVILAPERETLQNMIVQAMARHGLALPELSPKAQQKQVARWRKR